MKTWAKLNGEQITAIANASRAPVGEWAEIPSGIWPGWGARPSPVHRPIWRNGAVMWLDSRSVEQARSDRIREMQASRDSVIFGTLEWGGSVFDANERSQNVINAMFNDARIDEQDPDEMFRLADNSWRNLTRADKLALGVALRAHVRGAFAQFGAREAAINAATTIEAVEAITWEQP